MDGLAEAGWAARAATSVDAALELLSRERFAAVVSDIRMADRDGFELLRSIRGEGVPVILMSSFGTSGTSLQARAEGAFAYLPKPFLLRDLLRLLEKLER